MPYFAFFSEMDGDSGESGWEVLQEYAVDTEVLHVSMLDPTLLLLYIKDLIGDPIYNIAIYAGDTTLYSGCDQVCAL